VSGGTSSLRSSLAGRVQSGHTDQQVTAAGRTAQLEAYLNRRCIVVHLDDVRISEFARREVEVSFRERMGLVEGR